MKRFVRATLLSIAAFVVLLPVLIAVMNSFKPLGRILADVLELPKSLRLESYFHVIEAGNYGLAFLNTFMITVFAVSLSLLGAAMVAFQLARRATALADGLLILFSISMLVPFQTIMLPLVKVGSFLHVTDSLPGLILVMIPLFSPFAILTYHGFVKSIPRELDEAAEIDGASRLRLFFTIIAPMMSPVTSSLIVIYTLWSWNDFALPLVFLSSAGNRTVTLVTFVYYSSQNMRWDFILAALGLAAIPVILFYVLMQRFIISGVTDGALKG